MTSYITAAGSYAHRLIKCEYWAIYTMYCRCLCAEPERRPDSVEVGMLRYLGSNGTSFGSRNILLRRLVYLIIGYDNVL